MALWDAGLGRLCSRCPLGLLLVLEVRFEVLHPAPEGLHDLPNLGVVAELVLEGAQDEFASLVKPGLETDLGAHDDGLGGSVGLHLGVLQFEALYGISCVCSLTLGRLCSEPCLRQGVLRPSEGLQPFAKVANLVIQVLLELLGSLARRFGILQLLLVPVEARPVVLFVVLVVQSLGRLDVEDEFSLFLVDWLCLGPRGSLCRLWSLTTPLAKAFGFSSGYWFWSWPRRSRTLWENLFTR